jgi:hypothetical protein
MSYFRDYYQFQRKHWRTTLILGIATTTFKVFANNKANKNTLKHTVV